MLNKKKKRGFQISFAWLFAIIVGAFILFLAIYGVTRIVRLGQYEISAETEKKIGILLNPLEIGFETGKTTLLDLGRETRIYNQCDNDSSFGRQILSVSQKNFGRWPEPAQGVSFKNKYIFSDAIVEGRDFYIFSKPFDFPFKVSDFIYLTSTSEEYCFLDAPKGIEEEISALKQKNILLKDSLDDCSDDSIKVCFSSRGDCDIEVNYGGGFVKKEGKKVFFEGDSLMYAAIFADKGIYECQLKRVMQRAGQLALLYKDKANIVSQKGCYSNLNPRLLELNSLANRFGNSEDLDNYVIALVNDIREENEDSLCKLW